MAITAFKSQPVLKGATLGAQALRAYSAGDLPTPNPSQSEGGEPGGWLGAWRERNAAVFNQMQPPQKTDELWRRVDLSRFKLDAVLASISQPTQPAQLPADWSVLKTRANAPGWVLHVNGQPLEAHLDADLAAKGVVFTSLADAAKNHAALLDGYLMTQAVKPSASYFAAMHAALVRGGVVLFVPKGVSVELPLRAATWMTAAQQTAFHHTLVVLEEGAKATLIEEFASEKNETQGAQGFVNSCLEIILGKNAQFDYASTQDWARHVYNFSDERALVGEGATLHWVIGGIGSKFTKSAIEADMVGRGGTALLSGVYFADTKQQLHYDTQQNHIAENCKSDLLYKAALRDEARAVWRGNIRVFPNAQKTDGYQANRNLQLSDKSRADSIPGLEIEADDVRCTHGATIGKIEEEPMFYLESRGIPQNDARRLIVEGFFAPVIERLPLAETRERLTAEIGKKIG